MEKFKVEYLLLLQSPKLKLINANLPTLHFAASLNG